MCFMQNLSYRTFQAAQTGRDAPAHLSQASPFVKGKNLFEVWSAKQALTLKQKRKVEQGTEQTSELHLALKVEPKQMTSTMVGQENASVEIIIVSLAALVFKMWHSTKTRAAAIRDIKEKLDKEKEKRVREFGRDPRKDRIELVLTALTEIRKFYEIAIKTIEWNKKWSGEFGDNVKHSENWDKIIRIMKKEPSVRDLLHRDVEVALEKGYECCKQVKPPYEGEPYPPYILVCAAKDLGFGLITRNLVRVIVTRNILPVSEQEGFSKWDEFDPNLSSTLKKNIARDFKIWQASRDCG
ncbi:Uncharacterised protein [Candidatus Anstonella stagnisolia]|nr:Uncharacterised protein [Candidatus Anstonella stagnisolia]